MPFKNSLELFLRQQDSPGTALVALQPFYSALIRSCTVTVTGMTGVQISPQRDALCVPCNSPSNMRQPLDPRDINETPISANTTPVSPFLLRSDDASNNSLQTKTNQHNDQDLQQAIELSMKTNQPQFKHSAAASDDGRPAGLGLSNEFATISDAKGDVLIYIGPPPRMPGQTSADHSYVSNHFRHPSEGSGG